MSWQYAVSRLVQPSKRRPFRAVVLEMDTPFLFSTETNSLPHHNPHRQMQAGLVL